MSDRKAEAGCRFSRKVQTQLASVALVLSLIGAVTSCGKGSPSIDGSPTQLPVRSEIRPGIVIAGDDEGWVVDRLAEDGLVPIWRLRHGAVPQITGTAPDYQALVGTSFDTQPVIGGARCANLAESECQLTVTELVRLDAEGKPADTLQLGEHEGGPTSTDSITLVGVANDILWVLTDNGLIGISRDWTVIQRTALEGHSGEPCVISDRLFLLTPVGVSSTPSERGPLPPAVAPDQVVEQEHQVLEWSDGRWVRALDGTLISEGQGGFCTSQGFKLELASVVDQWTPSRGWVRSSVPPPTTIDPSLPRAESSTNKTYELQPTGALLESPDFQGRTVAGLTLPAQRMDRPAALFVDDSASTRVGCVSVSTATNPNPGAICALSVG